MAHNSGCYFNCSQSPKSLSPNPDISGVGVLVGYTATAGIVVLILVFHYHIAHDPTEDPFRKEMVSGASASRNPRPNPIDVVYLGLSSKALAWLRSRLNLPKAAAHPRLEAAFNKCVQSMSDLQILTGISILISGYVQLRCGLSAFHWQIIVLLAWFSSITHLSCLTFLRNYLYNRPKERVWRLVAMGLMLLMLLVAMVPTGGYHWYYCGDGYSTPMPSDYAICNFRPAENGDALTYSTMVISAVLLALGFIYRVVRLHRSLSVSVVDRARTVCSEKARAHLIRTYARMDMGNSGLTLKRMFLYRPLLALFLTARALLDLWNSMFVEILWMVGSFIWGLIRLLRTLQIDDGGSSDWSFGQVVPIVLLAAPLLIIFESFFQAEQTPNTLSTALVQIHAAYSHFETSSNTPLQERDHPDQDFYQNYSWTHSLIYLVVVYAIGTTTEVLVLSGLANMKLVVLLIPNQVFLVYFPIYTTLIIWVFIMFSMLLEDIGCAQGNVLRSFMGMTRKNLLRGCRIILVGLSLTGGFTRYRTSVVMPLYFLCASAAMYCVLSVMVHFTTKRHGNVFF